MKAYSVSYSSNMGTFAGERFDWFTCKAKAIEKGKALHAAVSTLTEEWEEIQSSAPTFCVYGVYKVIIPTKKKELIRWLNDEGQTGDHGIKIWGPR